MKVFGRALSMPGRPDVRKTETQIRLGVFLAVLAAIAAAFLLRGQLTLDQAGYGGLVEHLVKKFTHSNNPQNSRNNRQF